MLECGVELSKLCEELRRRGGAGGGGGGGGGAEPGGKESGETGLLEARIDEHHAAPVLRVPHHPTYCLYNSAHSPMHHNKTISDKRDIPEQQRRRPVRCTTRCRRRGRGSARCCTRA